MWLPAIRPSGWPALPLLGAPLHYREELSYCQDPTASLLFFSFYRRGWVLLLDMGASCSDPASGVTSPTVWEASHVTHHCIATPSAQPRALSQPHWAATYSTSLSIVTVQNPSVPTHFKWDFLVWLGWKRSSLKCYYNLYFSFISVDICTLPWAMLANVCLIRVLWMWPRSFLRPQPRHLLMKALCWWSFNGTGRISHLWWGSVWRLIADLGSPLCRRRGISSAATRTVRSCQLFVKHGWKIRAAFLFFFFAESAADTQACRGLGRWGELRGVRLVAGPFDQLLEEAEVSSCGGHIPCVLLKSISLSTLVQQEDTEKTARSLVEWILLILSLQKKKKTFFVVFSALGISSYGTLNFSSLYRSVLSKSWTASVQPSNGSNISGGSRSRKTRNITCHASETAQSKFESEHVAQCQEFKPTWSILSFFPTPPEAHQLIAGQMEK